MGIENVEVARVFREVADLLEIREANPFRVRAYRTAARTVEEMPEPVAELAGDLERLDALPGVGEDLAGKIATIVRTGTLPMLAELRGEMPECTADLLRVPGVGPKRAKALVEGLGLRSLEDLREAAEAGRVRVLPGFGEVTERKILRELAARRTEERRMSRAAAAQYGEALLEYLRACPGVARAEIAGSFRRARETVGDLDILVTARRGAGVVEAFATYAEVTEVIARGPTRASVRLRCELQVDLRLVPETSYGAALHYFTGSKAHNIAVRRLGQQRGLKINEYGVYRGRRRTAGRTEDEIFRSVGLPWIPPELREDRGEIQAAAAGTLPELVELRQIRGDLQLHTPDSDGRDSLEVMADAAIDLGYEYLAVTDHSPAVRITRGMDSAGFRRQMKRIDRLNTRLKGLTILKGAEVDILPDGSLDLPDRLLRDLDIVVASLHSALDLPREEQTRRVLRALGNRSVDILAHPTARLIGRRRGVALDMSAVIQAAHDGGVMLEVNAQPERLDLDDLGARQAADRKVMLVVSTDAHSAAELRFMRWGVDQARRGWVEQRHVANTRPLADLLSLLHRARGG